jgi:hypothetical protein
MTLCPFLIMQNHACSLSVLVDAMLLLLNIWHAVEINISEEVTACYNALNKVLGFFPNQSILGVL